MAWSVKTAPHGSLKTVQCRIFGSIAKLVKVQSGYEAALAAVLGAAADALAADSFSAAADAVTALKHADGGRAAIVLSDWPAHESAPVGALPDGARWALDLVEAPARLRGALVAMLSGVAVVGGLSEAMSLVAELRSCARSPVMAIWSAPAGSSAAPTANRRRWSSPPRSPRRGPNSPRPRRRPTSWARRCPGR